MIDFSEALRELRNGHKVARVGWNGKGMWITLSPGSYVPAKDFWAPNNREFAKTQPEGVARVLPYITMKTADDAIVPWLASQTDILATDWQVMP